ncbi:NAD-dependent epimerase/dehydratase family protein [Halosimplex pelagicum]|uniref:NAD(P)-dependent oxidoreductase n=1 Tax=Halosimplex pelagicum TaxID=869886 RepID=A0A7D5P9Q6_9EURY|nr:NAD(P)-dependent oxidoreductase [Halosimplex pelagicum]QLH80882.1 NAD(P)-dependent oxidoreductase [Halosimplex pelagicum]
MATVLVTGGTGFIGAYVAADLVEHGHDVVAFDLSTEETRLAKLGVADEVEVIGGDVTDPTAVVRTVRETGATHVVHLAALLTDGAEANPRAALEVNCEGTNNVFEAARTLPDQVERVAWASSAAVYAPPESYESNDRGGWVTEDDLVYPDTLYGATKEYNEHQARVYGEEYGVSHVGLRPTVAYGPYRETGGSAFLIDLIEKPALGESFSVDYGDQVIDWQYVRDVAQAFRKAAFADESELSRRIYNVRGECATVREAAEAVSEVVPDAEISVSDEGELPWTQTLDIAPAREDLGYDPEYDLEAGIAEYVSVLREERGLDPL